jgi:hypothetical protein
MPQYQEIQAEEDLPDSQVTVVAAAGEDKEFLPTVLSAVLVVLAGHL